MARYSETDAKEIYAIADAWRRDCLIGEKSLLWKGENIWTEQNLKDFQSYFTANPDESKSSFEEKFKQQLEPAGPDLTKLACEIVLVYFLFPSSVSGNRKREVVNAIASWKNIAVPADGAAILSHLDAGIGGPGLAYNTRRPIELSYLGKVALDLGAKTQSERQAILTDDRRFRKLLDEAEDEGTLQSRDILLHLLFPDRYERIASRNHKQLIADTFQELLDAGKAPEDMDEKIFEIRTALEKLIPGKALDFYWRPLRECWYVSGEEDDLSPLQGLSIKRQVVLYGPPGTGKTFEARELADRLIRQGLLRAWGPKRHFSEPDSVVQIVKDRTRRVQFHPGYTYEDLVRGLRLVDGGRTEYADGVLLRIIKEIEEASSELQKVPFVLILDELNRADLSKVLGECFSLLEDRDAAVQLAGQDEKPREVLIPEQLHIIGTMNLIDQSLEQIDFALRRRFLWFFRGFNREQFLHVSRTRWHALRDKGRLKKDWDKFGPEFETLADRAESINREIGKHPSLGPQYQIGHTYFCDVVYFVEKELAARPGRHFVLYSDKGRGRDKTIGALWKYSLGPLLEQYLSGVDTNERQLFISKAEQILTRGNSS
jgi:5-methylcytosine-specific restriction enzyme B